MSSRTSTVRQGTMSARFANFLENIHRDPKPVFNFEEFKTSTEACLKACAESMLKEALLQPDNIVAYANVAREIFCNGSKKSVKQKSFGDFLCEICLSKIEKWFSIGVTYQWNCINNFGRFLGEIYIRQGLRNDVINKWLSSVTQMVTDNNPNATKAQLMVLQLIFTKMKQRDPATYKLYLRHVQLLSLHGRIPVELQQWSKTVLGEAPSTACKTESVSSIESEIDEASTSAVETPILDP